MATGSLGFNAFDDDEEDLRRELMPETGEERASASMSSPQHQLGAQEEEPAPPRIPAAIEDPSGPSTAAAPSEEEPAAGAHARAADQLQGSASSPFQEALANFQTATTSPQTAGEIPLPRPGYEGAWEQARAAEAKGSLRYLKAQGVHTTITPDGGEVIDTHPDGAPRWNPTTSAPFQGEDGQWYVRNRNDRGDLADTPITSTRGLLHTDAQTGERYFIGPDKQPVVVGTDSDVVNRNALLATRRQLRSEQAAHELSAQELEASLQEPKAMLATLRKSAVATDAGENGLPTATDAKTVGSLENTIQNLRLSVEAGGADDFTKQQLAEAEQQFATWKQRHPEYDTLRGVIDQGESQVRGHRQAILDARAQALALDGSPAVSILPSRLQAAAPDGSDDLTQETAALAGQRGSTMAQALPLALMRAKAAGIQQVGGRPIDDVIAEAQKPRAPIEPAKLAEPPAKDTGWAKNFVASAINDIAKKVYGIGENIAATRSLGPLGGYFEGKGQEYQQERKWLGELETGQYSPDNPYRPGGPKAGFNWNFDPTGPLHLTALFHPAFGADYIAPERQKDFATGIAKVLPDLAPIALGPAGLAVFGLEGTSEGAVEAREKGENPILGAGKGFAKTAVTLAAFHGAGKLASQLVPDLVGPVQRFAAATLTAGSLNTLADVLVNKTFGGNAIPQTPAEWAQRILFAWGFGALHGVHDAALPKKIAALQIQDANFEKLEQGAQESTIIPDDQKAAMLKGLAEQRAAIKAQLDQHPKLVAALNQKLNAEAAKTGGGETTKPTAEPAQNQEQAAGGEQPPADYGAKLAQLDQLRAAAASEADPIKKADLIDAGAKLETELHALGNIERDQLPADVRGEIAQRIEVPNAEARLRDKPATANMAAGIGRAVRGEYISPETEEALGEAAKRAGEKEAVAQHLTDQHVGLLAGKDLESIIRGESIPANRARVLEENGLVEAHEGPEGTVYHVTDDALPLLSPGFARAVKNAPPGRLRFTVTPGAPQDVAATFMRQGQRQLGEALTGAKRNGEEMHRVNVRFQNEKGEEKNVVMPLKSTNELSAIAKAVARVHGKGRTVLSAETEGAKLSEEAAKEREERALRHGDEVHATLPDGTEVKGFIVGKDKDGNAILRDAKGEEHILPEKLNEEEAHAPAVEKPVEVLRHPSSGPAEEVAGGESGDVQKPAGARPGEEAGLPADEEGQHLSEAGRRSAVAVLKVLHNDHEVAALMKGLGARVVVVPGEHDTAGLTARSDGTLAIYPEDLAKQFEVISSEGAKGKEWIHKALREEIAHFAQFKIANWRQRHADVWNDPNLDPALKKAVEEAYHFPALPEDASERQRLEADAQKGAEAVRMVVQQRWTGTITEKVLRIIDDLLKVLKGLKVDEGNDLLSQTVRDVESVLERARKGGEDAGEEGQLSASKAPRQIKEETQLREALASRLRDEQSTAEKDEPNGLVGNAVMLADLSEGASVAKHGLSGLDVPRQRMVLSAMESMLKNPQVLDSVVQSIPVDVVHVLGGKEATPEMLLHDVPMFLHLLSVNGDKAVSVGVNAARAAMRVIASAAAKVELSNLRGEPTPFNRGTTVIAGNVDHSEILRAITSVATFDPSRIKITHENGKEITAADLGNTQALGASKAIPKEDQERYEKLAQERWESITKTPEETPTDTERFDIKKGYERAVMKHGFAAVPIADVLEDAGFDPKNPADMDRGRGIVMKMFHDGEITSLPIGDWSISTPRERAWSVNKFGAKSRMDMKGEDRGILMRMQHGEEIVRKMGEEGALGASKARLTDREEEDKARSMPPENAAAPENADASKQSSQEARVQAAKEVEKQIQATKKDRQKGVEDYQIETDEDQPEMWSVDHPEASGSWIVTQGENGKWRGEKDGSLTKEYATREEAIADARERVADEVNSARGAFGDNLDNTHAVAPIFEHFALPKGAQFVEPWFRTKWGSWYASVEMPDGNRLKLSVRDHDASRRDMGIPDYSGEVSKNWTPREVVAALDRVEKWLFKKANAEPVSESGAAGFKTEPSQAGTSGNVNPESRPDSRAPEEGALGASKAPTPGEIQKRVEDAKDKGMESGYKLGRKEAKAEVRDKVQSGIEKKLEGKALINPVAEQKRDYRAQEKAGAAGFKRGAAEARTEAKIASNKLRAQMLDMVTKDRAYREGLRLQEKAAKAAGREARKETTANLAQQDRWLSANWKQAKDALVEHLNQSLPLAERGQFLNRIAGLDRPGLLSKDPDRVYHDAFKILRQIDAAADEHYRQGLIDEIEKTAKEATGSKSVDIDFKKKISDLIRGFSFVKLSSGKRSDLELEQKWAGTEPAKLADEIAARVDQGGTISPAERSDFATRMRRLNDEEKAELDRRLQRLELSRRPDYFRGLRQELGRLSKAHIGTLSTDALEALRDQIDLLEAQGRLLVKRRGDLQAAKTAQAMQALSQATPKKWENDPINADLPPGTPDGKRDLTLKGRLANRVIKMWNQAKFTMNALLPIDALFDLADGGNGTYDGFLHRHVKGPVDLAYGLTMRQFQGVEEGLKEIIDRYHLNQNHSERVGIHAIAMQEGGRERLIAQGFPAERINDIQNSLSPGERAAYEYMRASLDGDYKVLREVMRGLYNQDVPAEENYFPMVRDWEEYRAKQEEPAKLDPKSGQTIGFDELSTWKNVIQDVQPRNKTKVNQGFTLERVKGAQTAVKFDSFDVFLRHKRDVLHLINMQPDLKTMAGVVRSEEFAKKYGRVWREVVNDYLDTVARNGGVEAFKRVAFLDWSRRNLAVGQVAWRAASALKHISNAALAVAHIGPGWYMKGLGSVQAKEAQAFLHRNMAETFAREGGEQAIAEASAVSKIAKIGFVPIRLIDRFNAQATALGAYFRAMAERGFTREQALQADIYKPKAAMTPLDQAAREEVPKALVRMHRVVASAHPKDAPQALTRGAGLGGNVSVARSLFMFGNVFLERWSNLRHDFATAGIQKGNYRQASMIAIGLLGAIASEAGITYQMRNAANAVTGNHPTDENDFADEMLHHALREFPFAGQIMDAYQHEGTGIPAIEAPVSMLAEAAHAVNAKETPTKEKHAIKAAGGAAALLGVPGAGQVSDLLARKAGAKEETPVKKLIRENGIARPKPDTEETQARTDLLAGLRNKTLAPKDAWQQAQKAGMSREQFVRILKESQRDPGLAEFERLPYRTALEVFAKASPEQKRAWAPALARKRAKAHGATEEAA